MAVDAFVGPRGNVLVEEPEQARLVHLRSIVLAENELHALKSLNGDLPAKTLSTLFPIASPAGTLAATLETLIAAAEAAVRAGTGLIILSDRGVDAENAPLPMLLAVAAVHHHLVRPGPTNEGGHRRRDRRGLGCPPLSAH